MSRLGLREISRAAGRNDSRGVKSASASSRSIHLAASFLQWGSLRKTGAQFNSFVEISTDFSTEFLVLQGVPHYSKNSVEKSVEKSVEISTKLLN